MMMIIRLTLCACLMLAAVQPVRAQPSEPSTKEDIAFARSLSRAFKHVARKVEPSVVHINQYSRVVPTNFFGQQVGRPSLQQTGLGSGVVVTTDGYILTNNHVIQNAAALRVKLSDGTNLDAKVVGRDDVTDIAVVKVDASGLTPADFADSDSLEVGEWVVAVGSPFGFSNTVTAGIVSAKGRSLTPAQQGRYEDFIQTDAAINPGNSGGPLMNLEGKIVGINTAIASRSGGYQGLGFAIPSNLAKAVMDNIIKNKGRPIRGWLGVELRDLPAKRGMESSGVEIGRVVEDSPASRAGLRAGDIITKFQGRSLNEARLRSAIEVTPPGTRATIDVLRDGATKQIVVAIGDQSAMKAELMEAQAAKEDAVYVRALGVNARTFTREMARQSGYRGVRGVQVVRVEPDGRADRTDPPFIPGDIIRQVNGEDVTSPEELSSALEGANFADGVRIAIIRGTMQGTIEVRD